jgi:hypothetical protein
MASDYGEYQELQQGTAQTPIQIPAPRVHQPNLQNED